MIINILHSNIKANGNELSLLFPLKFNAKRLQINYDIKINYHKHITEKLYLCDILIISSWFIGRELKWWGTEKEKIYQFLEIAKSKVNKVIWFDLSDSTGTTQFLVLPYVDSYLKCQIFRDKNQYLKKYYGNRIFTNYYHEKFDINDDNSGEEHLGVIPENSDLDKISVGWNTGMANYSCYSSYWSIISHYLNNIDLPLFYPSRWVSTGTNRTINYSCRIGYSYQRDSVAYQRQQIANLLIGKISVNKLKRRKYFSEMEKSIISISPFGLGEITLRDYEIIISGSAIFKANCDHMETWPKLFEKNETYIDYKWDLSDFEEKISYFVERPDLCRDIAENCQNIYMKLLTSDVGYDEFCQRFSVLIS
jgi:hypothetical protein